MPSDIVSVLYGDEQPAAGTSVGRTLEGSDTASPLVRVTVRPGPGVRCYAVTERLPAGVTPLQITPEGVFSTKSCAIRWGPFLDGQTRTLRFRLSGPKGSYRLSGEASFDGFSGETPGERVAVLDSQLYLAHAVEGNWTFNASLVVTSTPPVGASCHTVEEFLPTGWEPRNITDGGLWDSNTLTVK